MAGAEIVHPGNGLTLVTSPFSIEDKRAMLDAVVEAFRVHGNKERACREVIASWSKEGRKIASFHQLNTWITWYPAYREVKKERDKKRKKKGV